MCLLSKLDKNYVYVGVCRVKNIFGSTFDYLTFLLITNFVLCKAAEFCDFEFQELQSLSNCFGNQCTSTIQQQVLSTDNTIEGLITNVKENQTNSLSRSLSVENGLHTLENDIIEFVEEELKQDSPTGNVNL